MVLAISADGWMEGEAGRRESETQGGHRNKNETPENLRQTNKKAKLRHFLLPWFYRLLWTATAAGYQKEDYVSHELQCLLLLRCLSNLCHGFGCTRNKAGLSWFKWASFLLASLAVTQCLLTALLRRPTLPLWLPSDKSSCWNNQAISSWKYIIILFRKNLSPIHGLICCCRSQRRISRKKLFQIQWRKLLCWVLYTEYIADGSKRFTCTCLSIIPEPYVLGITSVETSVQPFCDPVCF